MTESDRHQFYQEVMQFITTAATAVNDLNRSTEYMDDVSTTRQFYKQVVSYLMTRLHGLTKATERMQKDYFINTQSPYRLLSSLYTSWTSDDATETTNKEATLATATAQNHTTVQPSLLTNPTPTTSTTIQLRTNTFAQRYVDEIAPPAKMREYNQIAEKHKDALLKEAKLLHVKFSEDILQAQQMEQTVYSISSMINEFTMMIESQSEQVNEVEDSSKLATKSVLQTDTELILTLERTTSHQQSMTILIVTLALLLLVLDYLTP